MRRRDTTWQICESALCFSSPRFCPPPKSPSKRTVARGLDVATPSRHAVMFSMREDGFAIDSWELAKDSEYRPQP